MEKLTELTLTQTREALVRGRVSARELTQAWLDAMEAKEGDIGAFITRCPDRALAEAEAVDDARVRGEELPPLAGIPMAVKDNICVQGLPTTCASKMLEDFTPPYDATAYEKLRWCPLLGKTNLDEFAMGSTCETSYYGPAKNPWDLTRSPGGSSGGAAAAVAVGEVWYAIGSDTGGSIRQPAAHCGVTGMKPTYGSVSRYGLVAYASSLDQLGPIARSAADCAAVLELLRGRDPRDATSLELPTGGLLCALTGDVRGRRIGLPAECFGGALEPEVAAAVRAAAGVLRARGAVVEKCSLPLLDYAVPAYYILACAEASSNLARFDGVKYGWRAEGCGSLEELYRRTRTEGFGPEVKKRILLGTFVLSADCYDSYYKKALQARARLKAAFDAVFQRYDLLLTPVAPTTAPRLGEGLADPLSLYLSDIYTVPANLAGLPALSMPCGFDRSGLPIGAQLIGPALGDLAVLDAAHAYQQETDWHRRHPDTPATAKGGDAL